MFGLTVPKLTLTMRPRYHLWTVNGCSLLDLDLIVAA
jgi:hypothetical protein